MIKNQKEPRKYNKHTKPITSTSLTNTGADAVTDTKPQKKAKPLGKRKYKGKSGNEVSNEDCEAEQCLRPIGLYLPMLTPYLNIINILE